MDFTNQAAFHTAPQEIEQSILDALKHTKGYVTLPRLAEVTGSAPEVVRQYVTTHPEKVRKSQIETDSGEPLYTLNTPLSGLADAWTAFRYINTKKF
jgi:hypothetical protein